MNAPRLGFLFVVTVALGLSSGDCAVAAEEESGDAAAIHALVAKINQAWGDPDRVQFMREVVSDAAFSSAMAAPDDPARALILNKERFCALFERKMRGTPPRERSHDTTRLLLRGPLAYEISTISQVSAAGDRQTWEQLNVFARGDDGWRLVTGASMDAIRAALAGTPCPENEEHAVRVLVDTFMDVVRRRMPVETLGEVLTEDFIQSASSGTAYHGVAENMGLYAASLKQMAEQFADVDLDFAIDSLKMTGDSAIVFGTVVFTGQLKDKMPWSRKIHETLVCVRTPEGWRITHEHSTVAAADTSPGEV